MLIKSLITFNFKFNVSISDITDNTLDSFCTTFLIEEKHWYVAFQDNYLFLIPYLTPLHIKPHNLSNFHLIAPNHSMIDSLYNKTYHKYQSY